MPFLFLNVDTQEGQVNAVNAIQPGHEIGHDEMQYLKLLVYLASLHCLEYCLTYIGFTEMLYELVRCTVILAYQRIYEALIILQVEALRKGKRHEQQRAHVRLFSNEHSPVAISAILEVELMHGCRKPCLRTLNFMRHDS